MKALNSILITAVTMVVGLVSAADASAVTQTRSFRTNPAGICQGALPAFETAIRKRPLAIQNEGSTASFVTCAFTSQGSTAVSTTNPTSVIMYFSNTTGVETPFSCTGVSGYQSGSNQFIVKSGVLPAGAGQVSLNWGAADFAGAPSTFPSGLFSVSCSLPPGAAINDSGVNFAEDVGA